jgi:hypothetical protein
MSYLKDTDCLHSVLCGDMHVSLHSHYTACLQSKTYGSDETSKVGCAIANHN